MDVQVKSYKRRTKSGKIVTVKGHTRKGVIGLRRLIFVAMVPEKILDANI